MWLDLVLMPLRSRPAPPKTPPLLLLPAPGIPASSAKITLTARASKDTTLGIIVGEKSGARYAVQFPWPEGKWQSKSFNLADFEPQSHGSKDKNKRLDPDQIDALLVIDASGYQGKSGNRTLKIKSLTVAPK